MNLMPSPARFPNCRLACTSAGRGLPVVVHGWTASPADCPPDALGFDFDGATFSHAGVRVTFEVLLASFGLETPALQRLGALVHFLDVGGVQPPESVGIESALAGLRDTIGDDDQLLNFASTVFDGLLASFEKATPAK